MCSRHPRISAPLQRAGLVSILLVACGFPNPAPAQESPEAVQWALEQAQKPWSYTLRRPPDDWFTVGFDDSRWKSAPGGFGTRETPGARVFTPWNGRQIWLRKAIDLPEVYDDLALLIHHDEDAEVYLNGHLVASLPGWTTEYQVIPIDAEMRRHFRPGRNVLAVHCRQSSGGQFIDLVVIRRSAIPQLPSPPPPTEPFKSTLITSWGERLSPDAVWDAYPRPQLRRPDWTNLNGFWEIAVCPIEQPEVPDEFPQRILVPFCLESRLGGVQRLLSPSESLWYRREFELDALPTGRMLLHFEAVDYASRIWVNGQPVGEHVGGFDPFEIDITRAVRPGVNTLVVRVEDKTGETQLRGKQHLDPHGIWYTRVSGIWQTVWLEEVPNASIDDLVLRTEIDPAVIAVRPEIRGRAGEGWGIEITVWDGPQQVGRGSGHPGEEIRISVPEARLWSPRDPHLYDLKIRLVDAEGQTRDEVTSYAGIREVGRQRDSQGHLRFTLNGTPVFHWGPLDQGWWPDGLLTPPADEAIEWEIEWLKSAGFNMIRKHIKVEPRRYYYHCDRLGMLVWQDQVSALKNPKWTRFDPNPEDASWTDDEHRQFMLEFDRMIDNLENHPSIVVWTPFNEAWGQHRTLEVGRWAMARDPSRLVNIASGGNFWPIGHIADWHQYPHPGFPFDEARFHDFIQVVGEFGGHGWPVEGHLWDSSRRNWGYGGLPKDLDEYQQRVATSLKILSELKHRGIAAGVYTQTTDVEGEINGLMTYDRKVIKIPAKILRQMSEGFRD